MRRAIDPEGTLAVALGLLMAVALVRPASPQAPQVADHRVDLRDLIRDTQQSAPEKGQIMTVWWMPSEYWEVVLENNPNLTPEFVREFVAAFDSYNIVAVIDGKIGALGGITYKPEAEVRSSILVVDGAGRTYAPQAVSEMEGDAKNIVATLKPVVANMMGTMGENMNFFLFPGKDGQGERLFDPRKEGRFVVKVGEREFKWRLPLGSLLPAKVCPKCGETFSGAYKFCPWDGTALVDKKEDIAPPSSPYRII